MTLVRMGPAHLFEFEREGQDNISRVYTWKCRGCKARRNTLKPERPMRCSQCGRIEGVNT